MFNPPDILSLVQQQPLMQGDLQMLQQRQQQIPGSVQYSIYRYRRQPQWSMEDTGMLVYHYNSSVPKENYLELRFCVSGNVYCRKKDTECDMCQFSASKTWPLNTAPLLPRYFRSVAKPVLFLKEYSTILIATVWRIFISMPRHRCFCSTVWIVCWVKSRLM